MVETSFVIAVILMAFVFDFINGFHDAANSIATIVATCVLTPLKAVMWAAFSILLPFGVSFKYCSNDWSWPGNRLSNE